MITKFHGLRMDKIETPCCRGIRYHYNNTKMDSDKQPQTKKQGHKSAKEKREGADRLGSAKGARLLEANQEKRKGNKKDPRS